MFKQTVALATAAFALSSAAAFAQMAPTAPGAAPMPKPMSHGKMMHGKPMMSKTVYVCSKCKAYYTPAQAKAMHYKDSMGHKLTKMAKVPAGYMAGGKMSGNMPNP